MPSSNRDHPNAPHNQPFNKGAVKNAKKNSWYRKAIQTTNVRTQVGSDKHK
jgi:hypothetical protein